MHYSKYLLMTLFLVVTFLLGALLVEVPFGSGLDYFHKLQRQAMMEKKMRAMYPVQKASSVMVAGYETRSTVSLCQEDFATCNQSYLDQKADGVITEDEWLEEVSNCAAMLTECVGDAVQQ